MTMLLCPSSSQGNNLDHLMGSVCTCSVSASACVCVCACMCVCMCVCVCVCVCVHVFVLCVHMRACVFNISSFVQLLSWLQIFGIITGYL